MAAEIIKCERISHPPVRFIGKRFDSYPDWSQAWENDWFTKIEQAGEQAEINEGDSYCVLVGYADGQHERQEFYLGEFFPEGTPVPEGFDHADLPAMEAALCFFKGRIAECYEFTHVRHGELLDEIRSRGMELPDKLPRWAAFERDTCPRFTVPDGDGNIILDYAVYLK